MNLSKKEVLSPHQLTDVLNYCLGRPRRLPRVDVIDVCVVKTWDIKHQRNRVQLWCEHSLEESGAMPKQYRPRQSGRPISRIMPHEVEIFFLQQGRRY